MLALQIALTAAITLVSAGPTAKRQIGTQRGDASFYQVGLGACGVTSSPSDSIAAVSAFLFDTFPGYDGTNPAGNPICGRSATASYNGSSVRFKIVDRCSGCAGGGLDFSTSAFLALVGSFDPGRVHGVVWFLD